MSCVVRKVRVAHDLILRHTHTHTHTQLPRDANGVAIVKQVLQLRRVFLASRDAGEEQGTRRYNTIDCESKRI
jgi:hypothetical protein